MLRDRFYSILQSNQGRFVIRFNAEHPIFSGHFPKHPVVPGACVVQIAEEVATISIGYPVRFTAIRDLKLRQPITPDQEITISILKTANSTCKVRCVDAMEESRLIISFGVTFITI